jgi:hypothetical protein
MNLFVNAWFPSWLAQAPDTDRTTSVDWIAYSG